MFIFKKKSYHEGIYNASIIYKWDIIIDNKIIGDISLDICQEVETEPLWVDVITPSSHIADLIYPRIRIKTNAYALIYNNYNDSNYSHIMQLMKDFKQMANDKLLDIDEDYESLRFIEVNHSYDALRVEFY